MLGDAGCLQLACVSAKHGEHCDASSVSDQNSNGERCKHCAKQHNRRNQTIPREALALSDDITKAPA